MYDENAFVTLTFDDEHLPPDRSLNHSVFQAFAKRVRRKLGPFRFFMCGEYGNEHDRPHYHACLFGLSFPDRVFFKESGSGSRIYTSDTLSALWPYGFASVGDVTFESAAYVARYVLKKSGGSDEDRLLRWDDYGVAYWLKPEYCRASNRPGIGASWWRKYGAEVLQRGNVVMRGVEMKPPRYYAKLCKLPGYDWVEHQGVKAFKPEDSTRERLAVREVVAEAGLSFKKREL